MWQSSCKGLVTGGDLMTTNSERSSHTVRVVFGPVAVRTARAASPEAPLVALVDAMSPVQAVLAQTAGADVVLPIAVLEPGALGGIRGDTPGLALAMRTAATIADRRAEIARSSRRVAHDLAGALNVIGLAADVGRSRSDGYRVNLGNYSHGLPWLRTCGTTASYVANHLTHPDPRIMDSLQHIEPSRCAVGVAFPTT